MFRVVKDESTNGTLNSTSSSIHSSTSSLNSTIKRIRRRSQSILDHLYQSREWADCDIHLGGKVFPIHRSIVCTAVPYLKSIFLEQQQQSTDQHDSTKLIVTINFPRLEIEAFEWLLRWSYALSVTINMDNVQSLLIASDYLQVTNVFGYCVAYLDEMVSVESVLTIKEWISSYNVGNELRDKINCFICRQFKLIVDTPRFLNCHCDQLIEMISDSKLNIDHEIDVFKAIIKWIKFDSGNRIQLTPKLLIYLRWCSLSYDQIINQIGKEEIIGNNSDCRQLIIEVLSYLTFDSIVLDHQSHKKIWKQPRNNQPTYQQSNQHSDDHQIDVNDQQIVVCLVSSSSLQLTLFDVCNNRLTPWMTVDQLTTRETHRITRLGSNLLLIARDCFLINLITGKVNDLVPTELKVFDWPDCISDPDCGRVYVSGGSNGIPSNVVYSLTSKDDCVSSFVVNQFPSFNTPRAGHRLAFCCGSLYAVGGLDEAKNPTDSVERYDEKVSKWIPVKSMITPRSGHGLVVHQDSIYVIGGYDGSMFLPNFEVYDPSEDTWTPLSPLIVKGKIISLIAAQQSLLVLIRSPAKLVQIYSLDSQCWTIVEVDGLTDEKLIGVTSVPSNFVKSHSLQDEQSDATIKSTV